MSSNQEASRISCAILAGGDNKRMSGKNKAFLEIKNIPIIQRTITLLKRISDEILLVTNSVDNYGQFGKDCRIVTDIIKGIGPLGGIHAGLSESTKEAVFFVACDMPFLHNEAVSEQIKEFFLCRCDALIPRMQIEIEPLHGIYQTKLASLIQSFTERNSNHSIRGFLETVNVCYWDIDDSPFYQKVFTNLNTPEDVRRLNEERR